MCVCVLGGGGPHNGLSVRLSFCAWWLLLLLESGKRLERLASVP